MLYIDTNMHQKQNTLLYILTLILVAASACTKHANGITGPAGAAGQSGSNGATIKPSPVTGYIQLIDEYLNPYPSSAGVTLSLLKKDSPVLATTDSTGNFTFPPLPPGSYDIHVTKPGFDSVKIFVVHSGGDEAKFIGSTRLFQSLTDRITSQTASITTDVFNDKLLILNTNFTGLPITTASQRWFNFYLSRSKNVTSVNYDFMGNPAHTTSGTNQFQLQLPLVQAGYNTGDTVYIKTCAAPLTQTTWFDYLSNRSINYPYLGDSAVTSFVWQQ